MHNTSASIVACNLLLKSFGAAVTVDKRVSHTNIRSVVLYLAEDQRAAAFFHRMRENFTWYFFLFPRSSKKTKPSL